MSRILRFAVVPVVLLGAGVAAFAGGPFSSERGMFHHPRPGMARIHLEAVADRLAEELDATEAQQDEIREIIGQTFDELATLHDRREDHHEVVRELLTADEIDREALEEVRLDALAGFDAASTVVVGAVADIAEVLSPEQRRELAELMEDRHRGGHGPFRR